MKLQIKHMRNLRISPISVMWTENESHFKARLEREQVISGNIK
jgi:hypothetical protein